MPDVTITAPVATDSIDRLTLGATDVRIAGSCPSDVFGGMRTGLCMAED